MEKREFDAAAAGRPDLARFNRAEVGEVRFRHWGVNERGEVVFEGERRVLLKRRAFRPRASAPAKPVRSRAPKRTAAARQKPPTRRAVRARATAAKKGSARPRRRR